MDELKALIQEQQQRSSEIKKQLASSTGSGASKGRKRYFRRGEIEEVIEKQRKTSSNACPTNTNGAKQENEPSETASSKREKQSIAHLEGLPTEQIISRLRRFGEPIMLFGESSEQRLHRLCSVQRMSLEKSHEMGVSAGHEVRNSFLNKNNSMGGFGEPKEMEDDENEENMKGEGEEGSKSIRGGKKHQTRSEIEQLILNGTGLDELEDDHSVVYRYFKSLIKHWEFQLDDRPDKVKRSAQGKIATKTEKQCKDYIRPLFRLCRHKTVPKTILTYLKNIVNACIEKEFVRANDAYISLAIGNAAWPIGVTMVGIHERTGREKINSNKQSHVMNNEEQRKYLTSVKRLITYAQSIQKVDPSKRVM